MPKHRNESVTWFRRFLSAQLQDRVRHSNNRLILLLRHMLGQHFAMYGMLTVVVPIYNVERYLEECLESIRTQNYPNIEVLMIDDGSPDKSAEIAKQFTRRDKRFRLIQQKNAGLGAARNTGIRHAKGKYLTFVDSDDAISYFSYREMISSLVASGSDFVVGGVERWRGKRRWKDAWAGRVHARDQRAITLDDLPEVTLDVFAWNKVFQTDFFKAIIGEFPEGILYEDQIPTAKAYTSAKSFDVISGVTYYWRIREDRSSITQNKLSERDLKDRIHVARAVERIYRLQASTDVYKFWLQKTVGFDFGHYYRLSHRGSEKYWRELTELTNTFREQLTPELWQGVNAKERILAYLISENRRTDVARVVAAQQNFPMGLPTKIDGSRIRLDLSLWDVDDEGDIPWEFVQLGEDDTALETSIDRIEWKDQGLLSISGFAHISNYPRDVLPDRASLLLKFSNGSEKRIKLKTFTYEEDSILVPRRSFVDYANSGIVTEIDFDRFDADWGSLQLYLELHFGEHVRVAPWRPKNTLQIPHLAPSWTNDNQMIVVQANMLDGMIVSQLQPRIILTDAEIQNDSRECKFELTSNGNVQIERLIIQNRVAGVQRTYPVSRTNDGTVMFNITFPDIASTWQSRAETYWEVTVQTSVGRLSVPFPKTSTETITALGRGALGIDFSREGNLRVADQPWRFTVDDVAAGENGIRVTGALSLAQGADTPQITIATIDGQIVQGLLKTASQAGQVVVDFTLTRQPGWGSPYISPTKGMFGLNLLPADSSGLDSRSAQVFFSTTQSSGHSEHIETPNGFAIVTDTGFRRGVLIKFDRPIRARDWQASKRYHLLHSLREKALAAPVLDRTAVCMSYSGSSVHDNPAPVAVRLLDEGIVDEVVWLADDRELADEAIGRSVVPNSSEAIEIIHRAKFLINNAHFPHYFRKRDGQYYIQTWHGTPLKKIANDVPPTSLSDSYRDLMQREVDYWDVLVAQSSQAANLLATAFEYSGRVIASGYPRNDVLFDEERLSHLRNVYRKRLGVNDNDFLILYAPTWRDNATSGIGANGFEQLDIDLVLRSVGPSSGLMLRGHSNTDSFARVVNNDRVIDVSGVSDLAMVMAASDMLITDYSSIFFDYQWTGKPIIGFATDVRTYSGTLRGMYFDYQKVFPGPVAENNVELAELLESYTRSRVGLRKNVLDIEKYDIGEASEQIVKLLRSLTESDRGL